MKALRMGITKSKLFSLLLSLLILSPNTTAQLTGCASIDLGSDLSVDCAEGCVPLSANVQQVGQTTQYDIISIPNNPPYPYDQGTVAFVGADDIWSEAIDLPFDFCFLETPMMKLWLGQTECYRLTYGWLVEIVLGHLTNKCPMLSASHTKIQ